MAARYLYHEDQPQPQASGGGNIGFEGLMSSSSEENGRQKITDKRVKKNSEQTELLQAQDMVMGKVKKRKRRRREEEEKGKKRRRGRKSRGKRRGKYSLLYVNNRRETPKKRILFISVMERGRLVSMYSTFSNAPPSG